MKATNSNIFQRFIMLFRHNIIHHYKLLIISLVSVCGGISLILFLTQAANGFHTLGDMAFINIFVVFFIVLGVLYAGSSFPGLRTREKSYSYLLQPASTIEKFVFEFFNRIILFILLMPIIYIVVFTVEGYVMQVIYPDYIHQSYSLLGFTHVTEPKVLEIYPWIVTLFISCGLLIFIIPFTGATVFMKYPLLKTVFTLALVIFSHVFLLYLFMEVFGFKYYSPKNNTILFISDINDMVKFIALYSIFINTGLMTVAYFKLKEKEA